MSIIKNASSFARLDHVTEDFSWLEGEELAQVFEALPKMIEEANDRPSQNQWNAFWSEHSDVSSPLYFPPRFTIDGQGVYRCWQKYIKSPVENLESIFHDYLLAKVQDQLMKGIDHIVEFGCGIGHNLKKIKSRNEDISIYGSDWSDASIKLLKKNQIPGFMFDMKKCKNIESLPHDICDKENVCFMTVGSLEQLGEEWVEFFDFMKRVKPKKSIHIEPIAELYDPRNYSDVLAIRYHNKRRYLKNFFSEAYASKHIKWYQRSYFGNVFNEGYTVMELQYD